MSPCFENERKTKADVRAGLRAVQNWGLSPARLMAALVWSPYAGYSTGRGNECLWDVPCLGPVRIRALLAFVLRLAPGDLEKILNGCLDPESYAEIIDSAGGYSLLRTLLAEIDLAEAVDLDDTRAGHRAMAGVRDVLLHTSHRDRRFDTVSSKKEVL